VDGCKRALNSITCNSSTLDFRVAGCAQQRKTFARPAAPPLKLKGSTPVTPAEAYEGSSIRHQFCGSSFSRS
jgi:hypothetical protein